MRILDVFIDNLTREEIRTRVGMFLDEPRFHQIATINPEFLLEAEKNRDFRVVLEQCNLRVADGFGITLAFLLKGERLRYRFPGADLTEEVLKLADKKQLGIYLAIRKDGLSSFEEIKRALLEKYPTVKIDGADIDPYQVSGIRYQVSSVVLCNFGAPMQELFLAQLKADSSPSRIAMGVGGSFDYLTGKIKRAPVWLRVLGLEWFWRLIQQPKRWKRIWNAVVVFPFRVIFATIGK
ncbi:MAG: WecB/TagA/CpsF family glycosyltransferase [Candidatus Moranbacteria bacterium]|nr:WecB/TagA/CpsF family glycosyltransferase [Candidatus Moranbacteria bacterium]